MTAPGKDWHWPTFDGVLCGTMTDRERLGLPDRYVPGRLDALLPEAWRRLCDLHPDRLAALCEDATAALADRVAAGDLLAQFGDPRIDTLDPAMIAVAGGKASIGLPEAEIDAVLDRYARLGLERGWIAKECPRHTVRLLPYALAKYPVTNREYRDFLLDTGYGELPTSWEFRRFPQERANHPVYTVSPAAAGTYAQWLAGRTGRAFRLPAEAEWEYAAAGPEGQEFPWGADFDADRANTAETGLFRTSAVGAFASGGGPFGHADMAGNVEEYVADDYAPYPGGGFVADHLVALHGSYRVARGGSFARFRDLARSRRRHGHNPRSATYAMGFRLAEGLG